MAISPIAARNAYGIPNSNSANSGIDSTKASLRAGLQELSDLTYSRKVIVKAQDPATQVANSEAATTGFTQAQSPQKLDEAKVKSLLAEGEGEDIPLPSRGEVEVLARRYLKVTSAAASPEVTEDKVKQLADFYGATPERVARFGSLVGELEKGQDPAAGVPSMAVA